MPFLPLAGRKGAHYKDVLKVNQRKCDFWLKDLEGMALDTYQGGDPEDQNQLQHLKPMEYRIWRKKELCKVMATNGQNPFSHANSLNIRASTIGLYAHNQTVMRDRSC